VVRTFFGGSPAAAASALFDLPERPMSRDELAALARRIKDAMKEGR
jgi:hypothetical protein